MTTSESVCLFHKRQYSSNIQRILNILRSNRLIINCDLNLIVKRALCTCALSPKTIRTTNEQLIDQEEEFNKLQNHSWFEEVNAIIQSKIRKTCNSKMSLYKLFKLICEISSGKIFSKLPNNTKKEEKVDSTSMDITSPQSKIVHRCLELTLPSSQLGHLLGRNGHLHKQIMEDTKTQIHFENAPYSLTSQSRQFSDFNLELFQSSSPLKASITGGTLEAVENAVKALQKLDQDTQVYLSHLHAS